MRLYNIIKLYKKIFAMLYMNSLPENNDFLSGNPKFMPREIDFLNACRCDKSLSAMFSPYYGNFNLQNETEKQEFFDYLDVCYKDNKTSYFAEKQNAEGSGIMLDFDMYHKADEKQVSDAHVENLIELIAKCISKTVKFDELDEFNIAVICRPLVSNPSDPNKTVLRYCAKKKMYKDGLHVLIPEVMMTRLQKRFLCVYILEEINKNKIFNDVIFTNAKHDPILDMNSAFVPTFFVGSIKPNKDKRDAYPLSYVWCIDVYETGGIEMKRVNLKKMAKYNIPLELSLNNWGIEKMMKKRQRSMTESGEEMYKKWCEDIENKEKEKTENEEKYKPTEEDIGNVMNNKTDFVKLLDRIIDGLDDDRAVDTKKWYGVLNVYKNLCNTYHLDTDVIVGMLDKFSQRGGSRYIGGIEALRKKYDALKGYGYMSLVWHWLKNDDLPVFKKCIKEFYKYCPPRKIEQPNQFDFFDAYDYHSLRNEYSNKCFPSYGELLTEIYPKCRKVVAHILLGEGSFVKKIGGDNDVSKRLGSSGFDIYFLDETGVKCKKSFEKIAIEYTELSYPKLICSLCGAKNGFNIWTGFQAKRVNLNNISDSTKMGVSIMKEHIMEVWANNNQDYYNYIVSWFAGIFTNLTSINKKALVAISTQGCGKGTMIEFMSLLMKMSNIYNAIGVDSITDKHNKSVEGKRLIVINEMSSTKDEFRSNFDKLKSYITDPIISVNPKNINPYQIENISNFILFTNHEDSILLEQNERRYAVFSMNAKYANNEEYFSHIRKHCFNQDVADAFYTYLLEFPAVSLNTAPDTDIRRQLMNNTKANPLKFLDSVKEEQLFGDETEIKATRFYQRYQEWCKENGERTTFTNTKFATIMKKEIEYRRKTDGVYYILPPNAD